jgi:hypothetical protein
MMTGRSILPVCTLLSCWGASCYQTPEFTPASLVDGPRVLAIVADPPEVAPGTDVALSALIADAPDANISFRACASFSAVLGSGSQYGEMPTDQGCGDTGFVELASHGAEATLPGSLTSDLFDNLSLAQTLLGAALPSAVIDEIRSEVDLAFLVEVRLELNDKLVRAVKRVLIRAGGGGQHINPPPPHFSLAGAEIVADPAAAFSCESSANQTLGLPLGAAVPLEPWLGGPTEDWLASYQIIDARGQLTERQEQAFYSWYTSAGTLDHRVTSAPERANVWHLPNLPGCARLWLVVRDGQGGESACGISVALGSGVCAQ